jgi:hypothetical protein
MRCEPQKCIALPQGFGHQAEFAVFQITQAAMDHPRGSSAAARGEIAALDQKNSQPLQGKITIGGDAIDTAADDHGVEITVLPDAMESVLAKTGHRNTVRWR